MVHALSLARVPRPWRVMVDDSGGAFSGWPSIVSTEEADITVIHRAGFKQQHWGELSREEAIAVCQLIVNAANREADETTTEDDDSILGAALLIGVSATCVAVGLFFGMAWGVLTFGLTFLAAGCFLIRDKCKEDK